MYASALCCICIPTASYYWFWCFEQSNLLFSQKPYTFDREQQQYKQKKNTFCGVHQNEFSICVRIGLLFNLIFVFNRCDWELKYRIKFVYSQYCQQQFCCTLLMRTRFDFFTCTFCEYFEYLRCIRIRFFFLCRNAPHVSTNVNVKTSVCCCGFTQQKQTYDVCF